jgi:site-specific DNA-methyltransferase (adenine-specific)
VSLKEIEAVVVRKLGDVPRSSIRSYLNRNTPEVFERTERGSYRIAGIPIGDNNGATRWTEHVEGQARIVHADAVEWLRACEPRSFHAIVTDPPYGLVEYSEKEQTKLRNGNGGGVWRVPPSFDGNVRSPLPRFTTLGEQEISYLGRYFEMMGLLFYRVTVPGANILVASNPLIAHYVATALSKAGLDPRGTIVRLVMTMRGGDRPKNAHAEFGDVSVMPRSMWEPWLVFRRPLEGRVQDNLRKWKTGGFRRISSDQPFGDVIKSNPTTKRERSLAPHPSLKPQAFLRQVVRGVLPMQEGVVLDPFAGSGSTLAAASYVGYDSVGLEKDTTYFSIAKTAIRSLSERPEHPYRSR